MIISTYPRITPSSITLSPSMHLEVPMDTTPWHFGHNTKKPFIYSPLIWTGFISTPPNPYHFLTMTLKMTMKLKNPLHLKALPTLPPLTPNIKSHLPRPALFLMPPLLNPALYLHRFFSMQKVIDKICKINTLFAVTWTCLN